jgi:tetratricopeptide (TPR) repeat protein
MPKIFIAAALVAAALACAACGERTTSNTAGNQAGGAQQRAGANSAGGALQTQDISKLDAEIARLEADAAKRPDDRTLRDAVADAYARRGALNYEARKLREALADYQSALSYDPANEEAQLRATQINQEIAPDIRTDDGKPVTVPAKPGAQNSNQ